MNQKLDTGAESAAEASVWQRARGRWKAWRQPRAEPPLPDEAQLLEQRRKRIDLEPPPLPGYQGLALSGGGIRSATFSLGVLQALAEAPRDPASAAPPARSFKASLLSRFDYLSTVSGGGFIGSFLVGLFVPERLRRDSTTAAAAADDAQAVLGNGPPERIRSDALGQPGFILKAPLAWLRENGRYLTPTGSGDMVYAAALGLRNWVSLHVVIGVALLALLMVLALLRIELLAGLLHSAVAAEAAAAWRSWEVERLCDALVAVDRPALDLGVIWWSSLFGLALLPLLVAVPVGLAYWLIRREPDGRSAWFNLNVAGMVVAVLVFVGFAQVGFCGTERVGGWLVLAGLVMLGILVYMVVAWCWAPAADQGVQLTRALASLLSGAAAIALLAVVETAGQTLYLLVTHGQTAAPSVPAALGALLAWLGKKIGSMGKGNPLPAWLQKLPLTTLGGLAGLLILLLVASLWALAAQFLVWGGQQPSLDLWCCLADRAQLWCLTGGLLLLAMVTGQFPAFINLSSLQGFYSARLIRSYLGASNGRRFEPPASAGQPGGTKTPQGLTASEPLAADNLPLERFWSAEQGLHTWAPLHIVNLTVNKTVDPAEQLVQRDRKGQPLAVLPFGFHIDRHAGRFAPQRGGLQLHAPMHLGEWVGASGAAFSTGIGRETSLGMSLLMGAANVRLGVWWASGLGGWWRPQGGRGLAWLGHGLGALFRTQTYLGYEFSARFMGLNRRWQYLSDGGHFENTALYPLLQPQRRLGFVLASDNGADPHYQFDDLANLIRLARIDLRMDVRVVRDFSSQPVLQGVLGAPEHFSADVAQGNPAALLMRAQQLPEAGRTEPLPPPCWILLLKPSRQPEMPADVAQYAATHADFPQQPTADQFFDEAQWESYRCLGWHTARRVLRREVWNALQAFMAADLPQL